MDNFIKFFVPVFLFLFQYFLSTRQNKWLGALMPVAYSIFIIYLIVLEILELSFQSLFIFLGGLIVLLSVWSKGRIDLKNKQNKELEKMRTKDIK